MMSKRPYSSSSSSSSLNHISIQFQPIYHNDVEVDELMACATSIVSLSCLPIGRRELASIWWKNCPNRCQAHVARSVGDKNHRERQRRRAICTAYCAPLRRNVLTLSKQMMDVITTVHKNNETTTTRLDIHTDCKYPELVHLEKAKLRSPQQRGQLTTVAYDVRIGPDPTVPWMRFHAELKHMDEITTPAVDITGLQPRSLNMEQKSNTPIAFNQPPSTPTAVTTTTTQSKRRKLFRTPIHRPNNSVACDEDNAADSRYNRGDTTVACDDGAETMRLPHNPIIAINGTNTRNEQDDTTIFQNPTKSFHTQAKQTLPANTTTTTGAVVVTPDGLAPRSSLPKPSRQQSDQLARSLQDFPNGRDIATFLSQQEIGVPCSNKEVLDCANEKTTMDVCVQYRSLSEEKSRNQANHSILATASGTICPDNNTQNSPPRSCANSPSDERFSNDLKDGPPSLSFLSLPEHCYDDDEEEDGRSTINGDAESLRESTQAHTWPNQQMALANGQWVDETTTSTRPVNVNSLTLTDWKQLQQNLCTTTTTGSSVFRRALIDLVIAQNNKHSDGSTTTELWLPPLLDDTTVLRHR